MIYSYIYNDLEHYKSYYECILKQQRPYPLQVFEYLNYIRKLLHSHIVALYKPKKNISQSIYTDIYSLNMYINIFFNIDVDFPQGYFNRYFILYTISLYIHIFMW